MKQVMVPVALAMACGLALAKLPPPDEAAKAKAAETTAKNAWQAKVAGYQLCKAQDRVAAAYGKSGKQAPKAQPAAAAAQAAPAQGAPAAAAAPAAGAVPTPILTSTAPPPPCQDPGPFAYNPPAQKPLETSGAHAPTGTAATPPSVNDPSAAMAPAKKP